MNMNKHMLIGTCGHHSGETSAFAVRLRLGPRLVLAVVDVSVDTDHGHAVSVWVREAWSVHVAHKGGTSLEPIDLTDEACDAIEAAVKSMNLA